MYFIIEIQTTKQGSVIAPIPGYEDKDKAISGYYYKLVFASDPDLSKCDIHTVMLIDHLGEVIMKNVFAHEIPDPTPDPEPDEPVDEEPTEEPAGELTDEPVEEIEEPSEEPAEEVEEPLEEPEEEPIGEPIEDEEGDGE